MSVDYRRPDRYRLLEEGLARGPRIARGGGYSYAAASFGAGSVALEMSRFNRVLRFDPKARIIEVEAGITLGDLFMLTARSGLCLAVQPGYPAITIGGCIAGSVHGKNPAHEGTFRGPLVDLTLVHPDHGTVRVTPESPPGLFDLTCGGYGLTGIIVAATLRLEPLVGAQVSIRRVSVSDPVEAATLARQLADQSLFAYTWHDATPRNRTFGRGFVYQGVIVPGPIDPDGLVPRYHVLTSTARAKLPFSVWGSLTARAFGSAFWQAERYRSEFAETPLFDAMFPFARRSAYFRLFGRRGFAEYQVIVPHDQTEAFLRELRHLILSSHAPSVMLSLKPFRGTQSLLRFERDGTCITLDLQRSTTALDLLRRIDDVTIEVGGIPNIIKDSRLPRRVVEACYPEHQRFREGLRKFDAQRIFESELSDRLKL